MKRPRLSTSREFFPAVGLRSIGVDLLVESAISRNAVGNAPEHLRDARPVRLNMRSNRGAKAYPDVGAMTTCVDHWRCRCVLGDEGGLQAPALTELPTDVAKRYRWMPIEKLTEFNERPAHTQTQGEDSSDV